MALRLVLMMAEDLERIMNLQPIDISSIDGLSFDSTPSSLSSVGRWSDP
ncbi:hypothetical protein [Nitrococcus mobilis]|nr:hypothetical protein [Nitrococcus mobilis]